MRQVDSFFSPSVERTLYHYTGIGSLLGIVNNRSIWASHVYYLNDSKEILHACDVLGALLRKRDDFVDRVEREFVQQFDDWLGTFRRDEFHVFVFSLSEVPSLLSQWRSYTPHGKGVSLGFSAAALNHILSKPRFRIAQCLYENREHEDLMGSLLEKMLITFRQRLPDLDTTQAHPSQKYHPFLETFRHDILQVLAIVKHSAFREEREWRIVSPYFPNYTVAEVKFREGASMLLPYTDLSLPIDGNLFDEVILGPSQDTNLSFSALANYLSNRGVCNMTVNSQIPLRKWQTT
jgi:hypothetical protein